MTITQKRNESQLSLLLEGRLDTTTAPELEKVIKSSLDGVAQKTMNKQGGMKVTHVNETIMEILEVTGFVDILTIEK